MERTHSARTGGGAGSEIGGGDRNVVTSAPIDLLRSASADTDSRSSTALACISSTDGEPGASRVSEQRHG